MKTEELGPHEELHRVWEVLGIELIELPHSHKCVALWEPGKGLGEKAQSSVYHVLEEISDHAYGRKSEHYWKKRRKEKFLHSLEGLFFIVDKNDKIVGFNGISLLRRRWFVNIYVDVIGTLPFASIRGLVPDFLKSVIVNRVLRKWKEWIQPVYVSTRTQNPVVYKLAHLLVKDDQLYPSTKPDVITPEAILRCANDLATELGKRKPLGPDLIWRNAYHTTIYEPNENRKDENDPISALFNKLKEKDGFVLIGPARL